MMTPLGLDRDYTPCAPLLPAMTRVDFFLGGWWLGVAYVAWIKDNRCTPKQNFMRSLRDSTASQFERCYAVAIENPEGAPLMLVPHERLDSEVGVNCSQYMMSNWPVEAHA